MQRGSGGVVSSTQMGVQGRSSMVLIFGVTLPRNIGLQCKNTVNGISFGVVESEVDNAEGFNPPLSNLYIATTAKRDAILQEKVRELSLSRMRLQRFQVDLLFWEDIKQELSKDITIFKAHYPQLFKEDHIVVHDRELLNRILQLFQQGGVIDFLKDNPMTGLIDGRILDILSAFYQHGQSANSEFNDPELENLRKIPLEKSRDYSVAISQNIFITGNPGLYRIVPSELENPDVNKYQPIIEQLHQLGDQIISLFENLIRQGRMRVGVQPVSYW